MRKAKRRWLVKPENSYRTELSGGFGSDMPPQNFHVKIYFSQKGLSETEADTFYSECNARKWKTPGGTPVRNWKVLASDWIFDLNQRKKLLRRQSLFD